MTTRPVQIKKMLTSIYDILPRKTSVTHRNFQDPSSNFRTQLALSGINDLVVCDPECDELFDQHGFPAYVSPEILDHTRSAYSGKVICSSGNY